MIAEALERLGVKMRTHTSGEYKDIGSLFRDTTPEEEAKLRAIIDSIYERFIDIVDQGRPDLAREDIAKLASGEMHTGARARELGLIDQLGDLDDAVAWAAKAAGIPKRTQVLRPRRPLLQMMMQRSADGMAEALVDAVVARLAVEPAERLLQARSRSLARCHHHWPVDDVVGMIVVVVRERLSQRQGVGAEAHRHQHVVLVERRQ